MNFLSRTITGYCLVIVLFFYTQQTFAAVISLRGGEAKISGDLESVNSPVSGFSVNAIGPEISNWFLGLRIQLGVDFIGGRFDYKGTDFPFESEKETNFNVFSFSPGLTFFANAPVQLQLGLPMGSLEVDQRGGSGFTWLHIIWKFRSFFTTQVSQSWACSMYCGCSWNLTF